ncbi:hypothetical protein H257_06673 [Aphanomyces astaci]|uniref:Uncharacterized protein n=1 Tax=Aphanomyces astaci TaxID=112090 RepID=W4GLX6_APHAT|nr:hypothetical protein H257_06673 [Aphanomyces astaci]ETV80371.1 hypothetical protein H257_06673 [Aphanomyces astaci]|eukprot:XP_009830295.1 hypothetical protein H257_06673 [Aphanomyces astaci]
MDSDSESDSGNDSDIIDAAIQVVFGPALARDLFRRRFRMSRDLFLLVMDVVAARNSYFIQRKDALGIESDDAMDSCHFGASFNMSQQ